MDAATDALGALAPWLAIAGLGVALLALVLTLRARQGETSDLVGAARMADSERRLVQLARRLDVLEGDADRRREPPLMVAGDAEPGHAPRSGPALTHVGLVRFDAFDDSGGAQSFALALIDDDGDGVVLTSLHARQVTRLYVKGLRRGVADVALSGEEEQALREAGLVR